MRIQRDPNRIPEILALLSCLWQKNQDIRFFQMIFNLQSQYSSQNNDFGKVKGKTNNGIEKHAFDFFYLEDDELIKFLKKELNANEGIFEIR